MSTAKTAIENLIAVCIPKMMGCEDEKSAAEYFQLNLADVIEGVRKVDLYRFAI